jgi:predicted transcriptional regulator
MPSEINTLRILVRLRHKGPATCETLASELGVSQSEVDFALEKLREGEESFVRRLPFGLWDMIDEKVA